MTFNNEEIRRAFSETAASFRIELAQPQKPPEPKPRGVTWDDVIGQAEAKAAVREAIEGITKNAEIYKKYGRRPTKGVLLFGPPGNGKTMLGKAAATAIGEHRGQTSDTGFIYVKGPELLNEYYGGTERNIRNLFTRARDHKRRHGYPAIIFIDEAESILSHRHDLGVSSTTVPQFLAEMDGLDDSAALLLLATNRVGSIDSAVIREGRVDRKVFVGRPSKDDAMLFFTAGLRTRPVIGDVAELAKDAVEALYDPAHILYRVQLEDGFKTVTLGHFTSGAQVAFLVDAAATFAIERELATGEVGIRSEDLITAVARTLREQRELDHQEELLAFCEPFIRSVVNVERVRADGIVVGRKSVITHLPKGAQVMIEGPRPVTVPQC